MANYNVIFYFVLIALSRVLAAENGTRTEDKSKGIPQVTRTMLHVARSLDPSQTEYLNVRGKNGEIATLIVKKREGRNHQNGTHGEPVLKSTSPAVHEAALVRSAKAVPQPVTVQSGQMFVKDSVPKNKRGRNLGSMTVGEDGVPVVEGVRMPDDENDKHMTWRNARVINGVLVPYKTPQNVHIPLKPLEKGDSKTPEKQEVEVSSSFQSNHSKPMSMFRPDDEVKTQWKGIAETVSVQPIPLTFHEPDHTQNKLIEFINKINAKETQKRQSLRTNHVRSLELNQQPQDTMMRRMDENVDENEEPRWVNTPPKNTMMRRMDENVDENEEPRWVNIPPKNTMMRRMDENVDENEEPRFVNSQPKEIWTEHGKIRVIQRRVDGEEEEDNEEEDRQRKVRISASLPLEARDEDDDEDEMHNNSFLGDKFLPILPTSYQPRLLQSPGIANYPTSSLYSAQPSRVSFEEGVRTPVLQYAHPELGVQPAKVQTAAARSESSITPNKAAPSIRYFSDDIHADRSPYAYEPGLDHDDSVSENAKYQAKDVGNSLETTHYDVKNIEFTTSKPVAQANPDRADVIDGPNRVKSNLYPNDKKGYEDTYGLGNDKYLKRYPYTGYSGNYPISKDDYYKWKMSGMGHGNGHKGGYYIKVQDNRPFWEKIGDSIKETVQSGVDQVKDLTRPVVEPIYEATQKISENLGIKEATAKISQTLGFNQGTGSGMRTAIQEKIGMPVGSSPVLLPALGLVAGGAALGLGAVAVGRLFDSNIELLKRSEDGKDTTDLEMEHKRALESVQTLNSTADEINQTVTESGRSLPIQPEEHDNVNHFKRLIDQSGIEELEQFRFTAEDAKDHVRHKRMRRDTKLLSLAQREDHLDNMVPPDEYYEELMAKLSALGHPNHWSNTPCAKRIFCDVMLKQSHDTQLIVEKKMATYLALTQPPVAESVSDYLQQVISAVKLQDCTPFQCSRLSTPR